MKLAVFTYVLLYYIGLFVVLPSVFLLVGSSLQIPEQSNSILQTIGVGITVLGIVNSIYCYHIFFKRGAGTPFSTHPTQKLIVDGPFKYTRNPLYLGQSVIILGEFLWFGNYALLAYLTIFIIVYIYFVIPKEEAKNEKRFGVVYRDYKKSVPRFL